jgi:hypothetical protein
VATLTLIEPVPVDDDLCTGLAMIEDLGFGARFVCYHRETIYETGESICVVKRKIVLPMEAIVPGVEMTLRFLGRRAVVVAGSGLLRLVK